MTEDEVKAIGEKLWALAERRDEKNWPTVHVGYNGIIEGEGGRFLVTDDDSFKTISIDRPFYDGSEAYDGGHKPHWHRTDGKPVDARRETCILAHEYGHSISWERKNWTPAYRMALRHREEAKESGARISASDHALIIEEENRAWDFGRVALAALGWTDWAAFDEARAAGLNTYLDIPHEA